MGDASDCHRCPFCERLHASKYGLAQHLSNDACAGNYVERVEQAKDRLRPKPPAKKLPAEELADLFTRLDRGE